MKRILFGISIVCSLASAGSWLFVPATSTPFVNTKSALFTTSDVVDFGDVWNHSNTDAFSISFWVKMTATTTQNHFFRKAKASVNSYRGVQLFRADSGELLVFLINTYPTNYAFITTASAAITDTSKHFVALTKSTSSAASGVKMYVDGVSKTLSTLNDTLSGTLSTTAPLTIGSDADDVTNLPAYLDEMVWWNRELTSGEVTALYGGGTPVNPTVVSDYASSAVSFFEFDSTLTPADAWNGTINDRKGSNNGTPAASGASFIANSPF